MTAERDAEIMARITPEDIAAGVDVRAVKWTVWLQCGDIPVMEIESWRWDAMVLGAIVLR